MRRLAPRDDPHLLVGPDTGDDAAVWQLDDDRALVFTADFITPVVDDARAWGAVAAANSVSDVYAMGGRPLFALNLVCWNDELADDLLVAVLDGADHIASRGGFVIAGGHTVTDPEPKFGLAVIGEVHPQRILTNAGLRPGDHLILTKPLGVGSITTAIKRGVASSESVDAVLASMTMLNAYASEVALAAGATGATDITGFGLVGHLARMARESGVDVEIDASAIPVLPGARELIAAGVRPGGTDRNLSYVDAVLDAAGTSGETLALLADPQTSGGLLFGVAADRVADVVGRLPGAVRVGRAAAGSGRIAVIAPT